MHSSMYPEMNETDCEVLYIMVYLLNEKFKLMSNQQYYEFDFWAEI